MSRRPEEARDELARAIAHQSSDQQPLEPDACEERPRRDQPELEANARSGVGHGHDSDERREGAEERDRGGYESRRSVGGTGERETTR